MKKNSRQSAERPPPKHVRIIRITDGDTVVVQEKGGFTGHPQERIRLWGIDAPESSQKGGSQSTDYLKKLIGNKQDIWLTRMAVDQYQRTVGVIHPDRKTITNAYNYHMVLGGHAWCYMLSGEEQAKYEAAEAEAQRKQRGIWKDKKPQVPRQFRIKEEKKKQSAQKVKLALALVAAATVAALALLLLLNSGKFFE